jgi:alkylation response protein AidB-like acyl-CoA dehydrogenase
MIYIAEQQEAHKTAREFVNLLILPVAADHDRNREFPRFIEVEAKKGGLLATRISRQFGVGQHGRIIARIVKRDDACSGFDRTADSDVSVAETTPRRSATNTC